MDSDSPIYLGPPKTPEHLLQLIDDAAAGFRHAEVIVQQRLYNFFMAESILLLASAAIIAAQVSPGRRVVVIAVSAFGVLLAFAWTVLGRRQSPFVELHMEIIQCLERQFENALWRVSEPIAQLRVGQKVLSPSPGGKVRRLSRLQLAIREGNLLSWAPLGFMLVFAALLLIGICGW